MSTIIEVRPDHGGKDAENFAEELLSAIENSLVRGKYQVTIKPMSDTKKSFMLKTNAAVLAVQWLQGSHVITRIPKGSSARHTSEATVVVRDDRDAQQHEVSIHDDDIRIDRYRGKGSGGQKKNKTSSAVRLTHIPTGIVITRETGRSQVANLEDAMADLHSRLMDQEYTAQSARVASDRQVLKEKIRAFTHNHQRSEVLCHRTGERWRLKDWSSGRWNPILP